MKITQNVIAIEGHKNASSDKRSNAMDKILPLKKKNQTKQVYLKKKNKTRNNWKSASFPPCFLLNVATVV